MAARCLQYVEDGESKAQALANAAMVTHVSVGRTPATGRNPSGVLNVLAHIEAQGRGPVEGLSGLV